MAQKEGLSSEPPKEVLEKLEKLVSSLAKTSYKMGQMRGIDYNTQIAERQNLIQKVTEECLRLSGPLDEGIKTMIELVARNAVLALFLEKQEEEIKWKVEPKKADASESNPELDALVLDIVTSKYNEAKIEKGSSDMTDRDRSTMIENITNAFFEMIGDPHEEQFQRTMITAAIRKKVLELAIKDRKEKYPETDKKSKKKLLEGISHVVPGLIYKKGEQKIKILGKGLVKEQAVICYQNEPGDGTILAVEEKEFLDNYKLQ